MYSIYLVFHFSMVFFAYLNACYFNWLFSFSHCTRFFFFYFFAIYVFAASQLCGYLWCCYVSWLRCYYRYQFVVVPQSGFRQPLSTHVWCCYQRLTDSIRYWPFHCFCSYVFWDWAWSLLKRFDGLNLQGKWVIYFTIKWESKKFLINC